MRITNTMITNGTMRNVNRSKSNLYVTEQQMSSQKKINRPSDDPVVAIRALSLRTSLTEIEQYLKKNVPDAESWMNITETSLNNMDDILSDIYQYCTQGSTDSFTLDNRESIVQCIDQLQKALYAEGDADYSGRYVFTGYRTDTALTFKNSFEIDVAYEINQTFTGDDFTRAMYMKNPVDISDTNNGVIAAADTPESEEVYRLRLAYDKCSADVAPEVTIGGTAYDVEIMSTEEMEELLSTGTLEDNKAYYVYDKGEIVFSDVTYDALKEETDIQVKFRKDSFDIGDIRPEHYFDCRDITNDVTYTLGKEAQTIDYAINFSQTLKVNTEANNVLSYDIARDLDDLMKSLQTVAVVEDKIKKLNDMKESDLYDKATIESMITAAEKELDYSKNYMESLFAKGMTQMKDYQAVIATELADLGSREVRLTLTKERLTQQHTTFSELKSTNEDVELEDIAIDFAAAETVYDAAIATASKTVRQSLLDYL